MPSYVHITGIAGINIHAGIHFEKKSFDGFNDTAAASTAYINEHRHQTEQQFHASQIHTFAVSEGKVDSIKHKLVSVLRITKALHNIERRRKGPSQYA